MILEKIIKRKIKMERDAFIKTLKPSEIIENPFDFDPKKHKYIKYNPNFFGSVIDFSAGNKVWTKVYENKGSLGVLEVSDYHLHFDDSSVTDLGNLTIVYGVLRSRTGKFTSLKNLTFVGGDFDLQGNDKIKDLSNLVAVGGDFNISYTEVDSLKNLMYVGGDLIMKYLQKDIDLGNLSGVDGDIYYRNTKDVYDYLSEKHATSIIPKDNLFKIKDGEGKNYEILLGYPYENKFSYQSDKVMTFKIESLMNKGIKIDHNGNIYSL